MNTYKKRTTSPAYPSGTAESFGHAARTPLAFAYLLRRRYAFA